ncbi:hypothetical protein HanRHA438_Chr11g0490741 [Helianthus annuus]|nr:hypothetical protein HanRHA438_Chr11g0490741 [Helianthus annuus]
MLSFSLCSALFRSMFILSDVYLSFSSSSSSSHIHLLNNVRQRLLLLDTSAFETLNHEPSSG